jgi:hypothetical protein
MTVTVKINDTDTVTLRSAMSFFTRFKEEFGKDYLELAQDGGSGADFVIRCAYCMIAPRPSYSYDDFSDKADLSCFQDIAKAVQTVLMTIAPNAAKEEEVKN